MWEKWTRVNNVINMKWLRFKVSAKANPAKWFDEGLFTSTHIMQYYILFWSSIIRNVHLVCIEAGNVIFMMNYYLNLQNMNIASSFYNELLFKCLLFINTIYLRYFLASSYIRHHSCAVTASALPLYFKNKNVCNVTIPAINYTESIVFCVFGWCLTAHQHKKVLSVKIWSKLRTL